MKRFFLRNGLLVCSLIITAVIGIFTYFNFKVVNFDWDRYLTDPTYQIQAADVTKRGFYRLSGNEFSIQSPLLIGLLVAGMLLSVGIWYWLRVDQIKTLVPLLSFFGFIIPLLPPYDENILPRLGLGLFFSILGGVFTHFAAD
jgi:hypothetical protein